MAWPINPVTDSTHNLLSAFSLPRVPFTAGSYKDRLAPALGFAILEIKEAGRESLARCGKDGVEGKCAIRAK